MPVFPSPPQVLQDEVEGVNPSPPHFVQLYHDVDDILPSPPHVLHDEVEDIEPVPEHVEQLYEDVEVTFPSPPQVPHDEDVIVVIEPFPLHIVQDVSFAPRSMIESLYSTLFSVNFPIKSTLSIKQSLQILIDSSHSTQSSTQSLQSE